MAAHGSAHGSAIKMDNSKDAEVEDCRGAEGGAGGWLSLLYCSIKLTKDFNYYVVIY